MTPSPAVRPLHVLAAPDKFRGTLTAAEVADAMAAGVGRAAAGTGREMACRTMPLADGGEGTLGAFGGPNRWETVTGPLGAPTRAGWRLDGEQAVIEMAEASGLLLAGGAAANDPIAATTRGTGELILAAARAGARDILVGVGGSAATDGGAGALEVLAPDRVSSDGGALAPDRVAPEGRMLAPGGEQSALPPGVTVRVCADVRAPFLDAAAVFGPQKGASPDQVRELRARLAACRHTYLRRFGIDVATLERSGAAGGLAGGLAAIGAQLVDGFATIADALGFDAALESADVVISGEGRFDAPSMDGKVVGGVIDRAAATRMPALVVCGQADPRIAVPAGVSVISLTSTFGETSAVTDTAACVQAVIERWVGRLTNTASGGVSTIR